MTQRPRGPVIFDLEGEAPNPAEAPPILDSPQGGPAAMQTAALLASRPRSRLGRLFWTALLSLLGLILSLAAWDFVTRLLSRNPALGWIAFALTAAVVLTALALAAREAAGFARLKRLDQVCHGLIEGGRNANVLTVRHDLPTQEVDFSARPVGDVEAHGILVHAHFLEISQRLFEVLFAQVIALCLGDR